MLTNQNRRGFFDWIVQRTSAVVIGAYVLFLICFFFAHCPMDFATWNGLFSHLFMKIATVIVVAAVLWHAWIGLWTVFTDYVKNSFVRLLLEILLILVLFAYLVWCMDALWG